jgi:hypothetical protein
VGFGPLTQYGDLVQTFDAAIAAVEDGAVAVVDVHVAPGDGPVTAASPARPAIRKA